MVLRRLVGTVMQGTARYLACFGDGAAMPLSNTAPAALASEPNAESERAGSEVSALPGSFADCLDTEACPDKLSGSEFQEVRKLAVSGDEAYKASGDCAAAQRHWADAMRIYAARKGCGVQRRAKSKIHSKQAALALETEDWSGARSFASQALDADDGNTKARLRRVRALLELGQADALETVSKDIERIKADGGTLSKDTVDRFRALLLAS